MKPKNDKSAGINEFRRVLRDHLNDPEALHQGLRERKKALMRQLISDTATLMFLERGFDEVRVSEVAEACDVSEKTIYNYFPTKESLLLDREEGSTNAIRKALGPDAVGISPVDAMVGILKDELDEFVAHLGSSADAMFPQIMHFNELIESTPALKAARADMIDRFAQLAAELMAARAGVDPNDPEPQIAADALVGLYRIFHRSIVKYSDMDMSPSELRERVLNDVRRAARLLDTGLWSFATVVQGTNGRDQLKAAAEASNEARKQVLSAIKQARSAWRTLKSEVDTHAHDGATVARKARDEARVARARAHHVSREEAIEIRRQAHAMAQEIRDAARRSRRSGRPGSN
ncbi:MAG TPA: TetR family transcriptional regulator [Acidimicrobiales bacterium]